MHRNRRHSACEKTYALGSEDDDDDDVADIYNGIWAWQLDFEDLLEEESDADDVFNIRYLTGRSIDDAFEESTYGEISLYVATCKWGYATHDRSEVHSCHAWP